MRGNIKKSQHNRSRPEKKNPAGGGSLHLEPLASLRGCRGPEKLTKGRSPGTFFMMTVREEQGPQAADTCEDGWIWCYRKRFQKMPMRID